MLFSKGIDFGNVGNICLKITINDSNLQMQIMNKGSNYQSFLKQFKN